VRCNVIQVQRAVAWVVCPLCEPCLERMKPGLLYNRIDLRLFVVRKYDTSRPCIESPDHNTSRGSIHHIRTWRLRVIDAHPIASSGDGGARPHGLYHGVPHLA
jgi:hypothetical protein